MIRPGRMDLPIGVDPQSAVGQSRVLLSSRTKMCGWVGEKAESV